MSKSILPRTIPDNIQWHILSFLLKLPLPMRKRCLAITKSNSVCKKTSTLNLYCNHHQKRIINAINSPYFADSLIVHYDYLNRFVPKSKTKTKTKDKYKHKSKRFITDYLDRYGC